MCSRKAYDLGNLHLTIHYIPIGTYTYLRRGILFTYLLTRKSQIHRFLWHVAQDCFPRQQYIPSVTNYLLKCKSISGGHHGVGLFFINVPQLRTTSVSHTRSWFYYEMCLSLTLFCQITSFLKVHVAFAFECQSNHFTKMYRLKGLTLKNKDQTNFDEQCDLTKKYIYSDSISHFPPQAWTSCALFNQYYLKIKWAASLGDWSGSWLWNVLLWVIHTIRDSISHLFMVF